MPWDLDDLEEDDEYGEMPEEVRTHLNSVGADADHKDDCCLAGGAAPSLLADASPRQSSILFLNVDGVLHPRQALHDDCFGATQLQHLRRIVDSSQARVVLSSTWRLDGCSLQRVTSALKDAGIYSLIGATPDMEKQGQEAGLDTDGIRACEIQAWLDEHEGLVDPHSWAVIDASHLDTEDGDGVNHTVTTDPAIGLTSQVADMVLCKLGRACNGGDFHIVGLPSTCEAED